jgi:hypothetical protein
VVEEREYLGALPHKSSGIDEHLQCGVRRSQCSNAEGIIELPEPQNLLVPVQCIATPDNLYHWMRWGRAHIQDQSVGAQGCVE